MTFGETIRKNRIMKLMQQGVAAHKSLISFQYWNKLERDKHPPTFQVIGQIFRAGFLSEEEKDMFLVEVINRKRVRHEKENS